MILCITGFAIGLAGFRKIIGQESISLEAPGLLALAAAVLSILVKEAMYWYIAANLAKGKSVEASVRTAKDYITTAIAHALDIGKGVGPTNHFYELYEKAGIWEEIKD